MQTNSTIYAEISTLPPYMIKEVEKFVHSLKLSKSIPSNTNKRLFGCGKDMFVINSDFDEPLEDFGEYF